MEGKRKYTYQKISKKDIIHCFKEMKLGITIQELENPSGENLQNMLLHSIELLTGIRVEPYINNLKDNLAVDVQFRYAALHSKAVQVYEFLSLVNFQFLKVIGIDNFSLQHLLQPTSEEICDVASAIIGFAKFRMEEGSRLSEYTQELKKFKEERRKLEKMEKQVAQALERAEEQQAKRRDRIEKTEAESVRLGNKLRDLGTQCNQRNEEHRAKKLEISNKEEEVKRMERELSQKTARCQSLQFQITENPDDLREINSQLLEEEQEIKKGYEETLQEIERLEHQKKNELHVRDGLKNHLLKNHSEIVQKMMFLSIQSKALRMKKLKEEHARTVEETRKTKMRTKKRCEETNTQLRVHKSEIEELQRRYMQYSEILRERVKRNTGKIQPLDRGGL